MRRNFAASLWDGLNRKLTVSGTITLGIRSSTLSFVSSQAVPKSRVASNCACQFFGRIVGLDPWNFYIRSFDLQQRECWRHVIRAGVNADFQQCRSWRLGHVHNGVASVMPASSRFQSADPAQVTMPADPPQQHLDEHAFVDLNQQLLNNPAAGICLQKRKWCPLIESGMRLTKPSESALAASIYGFGQ